MHSNWFGPRSKPRWTTGPWSGSWFTEFAVEPDRTRLQQQLPTMAGIMSCVTRTWNGTRQHFKLGHRLSQLSCAAALFHSPHNMAFHTTFFTILLFILLYGCPFILLAGHVASKSPWLISKLDNSVSFMYHCHSFDFKLTWRNTDEPYLWLVKELIYMFTLYTRMQYHSSWSDIPYLQPTPWFRCNVATT